MAEVLEGVSKTFVQRHGPEQIEIPGPYEISEVMKSVSQNKYNYGFLNDLLFVRATDTGSFVLCFFLIHI